MSRFEADDHADSTWRCWCGGELTHTSFGYNKATKGAQKIKWVDSQGKWTTEKPAEDFVIGDLQVMVDLPRSL
jgi:hypothetical protein